MSTINLIIFIALILFIFCSNFYHINYETKKYLITFQTKNFFGNTTLSIKGKIKEECIQNIREFIASSLKIEDKEGINKIIIINITKLDD